MNILRFSTVSAAAVSLALTACTGNTHHASVPAGTSSQAGLLAQRRIDAAVANHGPETEHGTSVMISEGNRHMVFPGSALIVRSADGVTVTSNGTVTRFSKDAKVDRSGVYHRYAAK